ncbi:hypothetical protein [Microbacterium sp. NIBRBAC000506063]|uniref:hypothetical protein n=1 Tax=Microbacterium sp. NIBRBAC000506063 TaxID=2734618 RepID=UPI001BB7FFA3|nr:hypothetical protein [Microbacterium sp. NIBRBAC000506063]QTV79844.1 hypothetical protein KAE78_00980 [Microbacterium sp. NIBRBAC000506063]
MMARGADGQIPILAAQSSQLGATMLDGDGLIDPAALGERLAFPAAGVALPDDATSLEIMLRVPEGGTYEDEEGTSGRSRHKR